MHLITTKHISDVQKQCGVVGAENILRRISLCEPELAGQTRMAIKRLAQELDTAHHDIPVAVIEILLAETVAPLLDSVVRALHPTQEMAKLRSGNARARLDELNDSARAPDEGVDHEHH